LTAELSESSNEMRRAAQTWCDGRGSVEADSRSDPLGTLDQADSDKKSKG
jgi:hypothetical protein